ncbi:MAG: helix-turn-helix domain-containing protein [Pseudonocardiaceae bacterium]
MRVKTVLKSVLGLCRAVVVSAWELQEPGQRTRPTVVVKIRTKVGRRGRCGRCGTMSPWFDRGAGERRWRHVDVGYATCELVANAPRVSCADHGVTVAEVPWARHDTAFSRAFEDLVVHDAIVGSKQAAARRYGISWRAVNNACVRVATEALGRVDLLGGLVAVAIDEVKYNYAGENVKGQSGRS